MSRNASAIADKIINKMRIQGLDCVTIPWDDFYQIAQRERIHDVFMNRLLKALKRKSFLLTVGQSVIVVCKDFNFCQLS